MAFGTDESVLFMEVSLSLPKCALIEVFHCAPPPPPPPSQRAAIVFLTDGKRISEEEETKTKKILEKYCYRLRMVSIFILYSTEGMWGPPQLSRIFTPPPTHTHIYVLVTPTNEVLAFYRGIVTGVPGADVGVSVFFSC